MVLQGVIDKCLDSHGSAAIAQMDIRRYYGFVPILKIDRYLVEQGCDAASIACLLRFHCCTPLSLGSDAGAVRVASRTVGVLIGTHTAGLLGRMPVEDAIKQRHTVWEQLNFTTDQCFLALARFTDNIFSTGASAENAVAILQVCEHHLYQSWALSIGHDSKSCMCGGGCHPPGGRIIEWAHSSVETFAALGHVLSDDGRIQPCVTAALAKMWRAFFALFWTTDVACTNADEDQFIEPCKSPNSFVSMAIPNPWRQENRQKLEQR